MLSHVWCLSGLLIFLPFLFLIFFLFLQSCLNIFLTMLLLLILMISLRFFILFILFFCIFTHLFFFFFQDSSTDFSQHFESDFFRNYSGSYQIDVDIADDDVSISYDIMIVFDLPFYSLHDILKKFWLDDLSDIYSILNRNFPLFTFLNTIINLENDLILNISFSLFKSK
jgi:hypothetical protein